MSVETEGPSLPRAVGVRRVGPVPLGPIQWRGFGGAHVTLDSVEFDRQLDKVSLWLEKWDHEQRCLLLESLLRKSNYKQVKLIWTVIQPALHRDFMYTAQKVYPTRQFVPISTYTSRDVREKSLRQTKSKDRQNPIHRIKSAHVQNYQQVKELNQEHCFPQLPVTSTVSLRSPSESAVSRSLSVSLPSKTEGSRSEESHNHVSKSLSRSVTLSCSPLHKSTNGNIKTKLPYVKCHGSANSVASRNSGGFQSVACFDSHSVSSLEHLHSSPACMRFVEMPVHRHIQEEKSPRYHEYSNLSSLSTHKSLDSELSLRERKKRILREAKSKKSTRLVLHASVQRKISKEAWTLLGWYLEQWNDLQRNEFLHKFLLKLDPRQHYFISSFLALKQYCDFISLLPENIALHILSFLSPLEIVNASRVSQLWYARCNSNRLWEMKCKEIQIEIPVGKKTPLWKKIFRENIYVKLNWSMGRCNIIDCTGHTDRVLSVTFNAKMLATGGVDKTIRVWSLKDGRCLQTLRGHNKGVWCLRFFTKNLLLSGSYDCSIRIWNLRDGVCMRSLLSHTGPVWSMVRRNNLVVSGSQDRTAKVWDISRCALLHTLEGHNAAVFAVDMDETGSLILTGSADRSVRLWDSRTAKQLKVVYASQTTSIMSISYSKGFFACSYGDVILLYQWNGTTAKLLRKYEEHRDRIETLELKVTNPNKPEGTMVSAGKDSELKYWEIHKEKSLHTFKGHSKPINCIHCDEMRIGTASYDNKVKIWDFSIL